MDGSSWRFADENKQSIRVAGADEQIRGLVGLHCERRVSNGGREKGIGITDAICGIWLFFILV